MIGLIELELQSNIQIYDCSFFFNCFFFSKTYTKRIIYVQFSANVNKLIFKKVKSWSLFGTLVFTDTIVYPGLFLFIFSGWSTSSNEGHMFNELLFSYSSSDTVFQKICIVQPIEDWRQSWFLW